MKSLSVAAAPVAIVVTLACALVPAPVTAQEFGVFHSVGRSDLAELEAPRGFGGFLRVMPAPGVGLRISYYRQVDTAHRVGEVCNHYIASFMCNIEAIETSTGIHGGSMAGSVQLRPLDFLQLEAGGGVSINDVRGSERTASGRASPMISKRTAHIGVLGLANGRIRPARSLPVVLEVGVASHLLLLNSCAEEVRAYAPYCGRRNLRELRVGIGYLMH